MTEMLNGKILRDLRERAGMSQAQLASLAGVSQAHVAKIEGEKVDPRLSTVNRIVSVLAERKKERTCKEIMTRRLVGVGTKDSVEDVVRIMKKHGISQIPVFENGRPVGSVTEAVFIRNMGRNISKLKVKDILGEAFPVVNGNDPARILPGLLEYHPCVLVSEKGKIVGIVTKSNLLEVI